MHRETKKVFPQIFGESLSVVIRGIACLKFNVRNCRDVVNAFMQHKKRAITNSIYPDETPQNAASHQSLRYLSC